MDKLPSADVLEKGDIAVLLVLHWTRHTIEMAEKTNIENDDLFFLILLVSKLKTLPPTPENEWLEIV